MTHATAVEVLLFDFWCNPLLISSTTEQLIFRKQQHNSQRNSVTLCCPILRMYGINY